MKKVGLLTACFFVLLIVAQAKVKTDTTGIRLSLSYNRSSGSIYKIINPIDIDNSPVAFFINKNEEASEKFFTYAHVNGLNLNLAYTVYNFFYLNVNYQWMNSSIFKLFGSKSSELIFSSDGIYYNWRSSVKLRGNFNNFNFNLSYQKLFKNGFIIEPYIGTGLMLCSNLEQDYDTYSRSINIFNNEVINFYKYNTVVKNYSTVILNSGLQFGYNFRKIEFLYGFNYKLQPLPHVNKAGTFEKSNIIHHFLYHTFTVGYVLN